MDKPKPAWVPDNATEEEAAALEEWSKGATFAQIMDKWREFWNETLEDSREREMMRKLLKQQFSNKESREGELERIDKMARALRGNLRK